MQEDRGKRAEAVDPIGPLIRSGRPVRLAIGALVDELKGWPRSDLPLVPDSWVLQKSWKGLVWRYERWVHINQEILAVAVVGQ